MYRLVGAIRDMPSDRLRQCPYGVDARQSWDIAGDLPLGQDHGDANPAAGGCNSTAIALLGIPNCFGSRSLSSEYPDILGER